MGFCLLAWHVHEANHVAGSILMGLSIFVNLFCFLLGLNHVRRAWARWRTLVRSQKMLLAPEMTAYGASFLVSDLSRGILVCDGHLVRFCDITHSESASTGLAHRLILHGCKPDPIVIGFPDRQSLLSSGEQLRAAIHCWTWPTGKTADASTHLAQRHHSK